MTPTLFLEVCIYSGYPTCAGDLLGIFPLQSIFVPLLSLLQFKIICVESTKPKNHNLKLLN